MDAGEGRVPLKRHLAEDGGTSPVLQWAVHLATQDVGSTPGPGTKILHAEEQLSLHPTTREPMYCKKASHMTWQEIPRATTKTQPNEY